MVLNALPCVAHHERAAALLESLHEEHDRVPTIGGAPAQRPDHKVADFEPPDVLTALAHKVDRPARSWVSGVDQGGVRQLAQRRVDVPQVAIREEA